LVWNRHRNTIFDRHSLCKWNIWPNTLCNTNRFLQCDGFRNSNTHEYCVHVWNQKPDTHKNRHKNNHKNGHFLPNAYLL
jgi:hypothetical protein